MVFILTGTTKVDVQEQVNEIIYTVEKQGRFDYLLDVREVERGRWKATLQLFWHTEGLK
jgi:hypothetical protein